MEPPNLEVNKEATNCHHHRRPHSLDVDWLKKALVQLEQMNHIPASSSSSSSIADFSLRQARNAQLCTYWKQSLLPQFKAITTDWWKTCAQGEAKLEAEAEAEKENIVPPTVSPQHSLLLALSRFTFLLPVSEHLEVAQVLADFARSSCAEGGGNASAAREPWLTEATIKLVAQNLQFYDRVLKLSDKVDLLEWICDRMTAATVADATSFTGPLLHYLQDLLDDLYNLSLLKRGAAAAPSALPFSSKEFQEEKVALLYKISKVAYWISYLLPSRSRRSKYASKVKDLDVVTERQHYSFSESEDSSSSSSFSMSEDDGENGDIIEEEGEWEGDACQEQQQQQQPEVVSIFPFKQENAEEVEEECDEIYQDAIDAASVLELQQQQQKEKEDQQQQKTEVEAEAVSNFVSCQLPSTSVDSVGTSTLRSVAFEINSMSSDELSKQSSENPKLKKKKLRLRRHVLRRLRRLCRNVRDDCNYQLQKCGH